MKWCGWFFKFLPFFKKKSYYCIIMPWEQSGCVKGRSLSQKVNEMLIAKEKDQIHVWDCHRPPMPKKIIWQNNFSCGTTARSHEKWMFLVLLAPTINLRSVSWGRNIETHFLKPFGMCFLRKEQIILLIYIQLHSHIAWAK